MNNKKKFAYFPTFVYDFSGTSRKGFKITIVWMTYFYEDKFGTKWI